MSERTTGTQNEEVGLVAPTDGVVQQRLTVAGLALTALFFSGSFSLAFFSSFHQRAERDYRGEFSHVGTTLALGVTSALLSIVMLLVSQQLPAEKRVWYGSRPLWFAGGNIALYLTLSQALSAGLTEIVYGVSLAHRAVGIALGILAAPVWFALLIGAPIHLVHKAKSLVGPAEHRALLVGYVFLLVVITAINAEMYRARGNEAATAGRFASNFFLQLVQPLTWASSWAP